jgi:hypothetical protein
VAAFLATGLAATFAGALAAGFVAVLAAGFAAVLDRGFAGALVVVGFAAAVLGAAGFLAAAALGADLDGVVPEDAVEGVTDVEVAF